MAALTTCAGLAHAPDQAPRSPAAFASQVPAWAGVCTPPYSATAQPKTSTTRAQTATAAAHSRLPRHAGPARDRFRWRAAAPGRAGDDGGGFGCRTGAVDTIALQSGTVAALSCHTRLPQTHPPPGKNYPKGIYSHATLISRPGGARDHLDRRTAWRPRHAPRPTTIRRRP